MARIYGTDMDGIEIDESHLDRGGNFPEDVPKHCSYCDYLGVDRTCDGVEFYCSLQHYCAEKVSDCKFLSENLPILCMSCPNILDCIQDNTDMSIFESDYIICQNDCLDGYLENILGV